MSTGAVSVPSARRFPRLSSRTDLLKGLGLLKALGLLSVLACGMLLASQTVNGQTSPRPAWTSSRLRGAPQPPAPYKLVAAIPQVRFQRPSSLEELPGTNRLLVTEMGGRIYTLPRDADAEQADLAGDLSQHAGPDGKPGAVSLFDAELHPKFVDNRHVFLCYVHPGRGTAQDGRHTRVSRFTLTADDAPALVPSSEQVIITWPAGGHNAGCLEFGKDGYLYIATGDGSGPNPPDGLTTGQDVSDLLGAILRIDVDRGEGQRAYAVPSDNPFVSPTPAGPGGALARPEIWAYGLRNPWKFGVDPVTGQMFAADNGWETWEMVHRIVRGGNCGWPVMEGRARLRSEVPPGPTPILPPVKDHPHTEANSVIGGPVCRGDKLPELDGWFVYGDYITGTLWALRPEADGSCSHQTLVDTDQRIVAFTQTADGTLYVLDYDLTGQIYELLPSGLPDTSATFPRRLSETGLFASLKTLQPAPGVVPYNVTASRWMDGATAQRWIAIPGTGRVRLAAGPDFPAEYPDGTVLVKQLSLPAAGDQPPLRLETQILHYEAGTWRPYSYLWDDAGQDAVLVDASGTNRVLTATGGPVASEGPASSGGPASGAVDGSGEAIERTWHVGAVNECKLCHNAGSRYVLGFALNQLASAPSLDSGPAAGSSPTQESGRAQESGRPSGQLSWLQALGVLADPPALADDDPSRLVDPADENHSLEDRTRSYLHANCSMCHHPGGNAIVSFYLRRELPFERLNTNKGTGIGTFGMRDARIIVPGDPYRSVLMYRMSKLGYARMPYIGSQVVDSLGVSLVEQWIRSLDPATSSGTPSPPVSSQTVSAPPVSSPLVDSSPEARALHGLVAEDPPAEQREALIRRLVSSTEGALSLIGQMHRGSLSPDEQQAAAAIGSRVASSDVRGLFETFVPESQRRATLGPQADPARILELTGDVQRGQLIYFSDSARCRACHEVDDRGKSLGPTLREINKKYPVAEQLLQQVLQPSLKIDETHAAYTVVTADGRLLSGLLASSNEREVILKTAEKQTLRIARDQVEEMQRSARSLMPERLLSDLTAQEAADLLAYLRSLGSAP